MSHEDPTLGLVQLVERAKNEIAQGEVRFRICGLGHDLEQVLVATQRLILMAE